MEEPEPQTRQFQQLRFEEMVRAGSRLYVGPVTSGMAAENTGFEFVHLVKGEVHRTVTDYGPVEWASLVALARSAGTLIAADLPVWPLRMEGWHCSPKWCGAWSSCRGRFAGPDPWNQLEEG